MEGSGFGDLFGDPDELQRRLGEFAEQMQGAQRHFETVGGILLGLEPDATMFTF